jgi:hypothetical protein
MPKNILIFSDGTGQIGGIKFDEDRSNIYKLFRATRVCADSTINPDEQVCFYDPGLGSPGHGGFLFGKFGRNIYNLLSQATGLGITANIVDCYAALIRLYRDGDLIFLFGFSRGAYTVRSLAGVIAKCGIPRHLPRNKALKLDIKSSRKVAGYAVKHVYQFCTSHPYDTANWYQRFLLDTRDAIAARFRQQHGSADPGDPAKANVYPYFIGVFDTVAALGSIGATLLFTAAFLIALPLISLLASLLTTFSNVPYIGWLLSFLTFGNVLVTLSLALAIILLVLFFVNYVKADFCVPGYGLLKSIATIHLVQPKQKFYDYDLNEYVIYAKHAISIDENRKDFQRVRWNPPRHSPRPVRDAQGNIHFEQVWFAGNHADIGGSYPENESRLSDTTLRWMLSCASIIPNGVKHDPSVLQMHPNSGGMQHDECKAGMWFSAIRKLPSNETTMHKSVYDRFDATAILQYDLMLPYRPKNLSEHVDFVQYYRDGALPQRCPSPVAIADDVETRFDRRSEE